MRDNKYHLIANILSHLTLKCLFYCFIVIEVTKSQTQLKWLSTNTRKYIFIIIYNCIKKRKSLVKLRDWKELLCKANGPTKWKWMSLSCVWLFATPWTIYSPGQTAGMDSRCLLQEIFPTPGSNPGLPHCRQILYQLNHQGSPRILEWVAYPFSRGSSGLRNWTKVSWIAGGFFTSWGPTKVFDRPNRHWHIRMLLLLLSKVVSWNGISLIL